MDRELVLSVNDIMIENQSSDYWYMSGDAMRDAGLGDQDMIKVVPANDYKDGDIVVAQVNGEVYVRRYFGRSDGAFLTPENVNYPTIEVLNDDHNYEILGVVEEIIHANKY